MSGAFFYDADSDEELEFLNHEENSSGEDKAEERKGQAEAEEDEDGEEGEKPRGGKRSTDAESPWDARRHTTSIDEKISKAMKHRPLPISTEEEEEDGFLCSNPRRSLLVPFRPMVTRLWRSEIDLEKSLRSPLLLLGFWSKQSLCSKIYMENLTFFFCFETQCGKFN